MTSITQISGLAELASSHRPSVVTIGNFDGVHRGHQMVIQTLMQAATEYALPATVVTFDPLAKEYFSPDSALRLQPLVQRIEQLESLGVEQVLVAEFCADLAAMTAEQFVSEILVNGLGAQYVSVGDDFRFGRDRGGDFEFLAKQGKLRDFKVVAHDTFELDQARVSSGRVRDAVQAADFELAAQLLGRIYSIAGVVARGEQRGRTIGFPTANITLDAQRYAVQGVYAVRVKLHDGDHCGGVANVGWRPTVDGQQNRLEVHLFDRDLDLYDSRIEVEFVAKIRDEKKFASFEALKEQIAVDAQTARARLTQHSS